MAAVFFGSIAAISFGITARGAPRAILLITISFAVMAIIILVLALEEKYCWDDLNEFKNNGSIKGVKAWQISEEPNAR